MGFSYHYFVIGANLNQNRELQCVHNSVISLDDLVPEWDQDARKVIQVVKSKVVLTRLLSTKPKVQRLKIKNWGTRNREARKTKTNVV